MSKLHQWIASCLGIGYIKGGGTVAALVSCLIWYFLQQDGSFHTIEMIALTASVIAIGIWSANMVDSIWGKDSRRVVIDEVAGMFVSLLFVPITWQYLLAGFLLFRFFDIVKPLYIRKAEALPTGWGVMADDILAGIYTNILLQAGLFFIVK